MDVSDYPAYSFTSVDLTTLPVERLQERRRDDQQVPDSLQSHSPGRHHRRAGRDYYWCHGFGGHVIRVVVGNQSAIERRRGRGLLEPCDLPPSMYLGSVTRHTRGKRGSVSLCVPSEISKAALFMSPVPYMPECKKLSRLWKQLLITTPGQSRLHSIIPEAPPPQLSLRYYQA